MLIQAQHDRDIRFDDENKEVRIRVELIDPCI
jgi:hypothetical protein